MIEKLQSVEVTKIWGGKRLSAYKKSLAASGSEPVGETWEISIHPDGKTVDLLPNEEMSYLVKLIDTSDDLSVQVHPGDDYAKKHENSLGKSECWLILEADKNSGIYLGLKDNVTEERLITALKNKDNISDLLNFYPVKAGDFFYVPAGTVHSIGKNITLAEVQQNSGITYRLWDWNRFDHFGKPRELHIEKSLEVIDFKTNYTFSNGHFLKSGENILITHDSFEVRLINLKAGEEFKLFIPYSKRVKSFLTLNGKGSAAGTILESYSGYIVRDLEAINFKAESDMSFLFIN